MLRLHHAYHRLPEFGTESIGITGQQFRWPGAVVPFEIDPGLPNPQRVTDAIAHWEANTRIRFRAAAGDTDVVRFVAGGGCSSAVGRRGGVQNITLGSGCSTGNAIHEVGHTVGLWHEQSREDRNQFVTIVFANIAADMQHNFLQQITDGDDLGAYDFGSIMHYPAAAFSTNGQDTIVPKVALPAGVVMGQRTALSAGDVAGVHAMYPGPIVTLKEIPKDPVRDTTKEFAKDPLRETVKESAKDPIRETVKEVPKDPFRETVKEAAKDPIRDESPIRPCQRRTSFGVSARSRLRWRRPRSFLWCWGRVRSVCGGLTPAPRPNRNARRRFA